MIGITCSFYEINKYINYPIKTIQILFEDRKNGPINVPINVIYDKGQELKRKNIIPYIHIDLRIAIFSSYRNKTQKRLQWIFKYAQALQVKYCVIHCGTMWTKGKRPKESDIPIRKEVF